MLALRDGPATDDGAGIRGRPEGDGGECEHRHEQEATRSAHVQGFAAVDRVPACVWRISAELVVALDARFGEPVDAYVNGSQTWLRDDGPNGETIEWRLHPVPGYRRPPDVGTYEVFGAVALALGTGATPPAPPEQLWEGLEAFPAYVAEGGGEPPEPATLAAACTAALGLAPDASGIVDHEPIGATWEASEGAHSIIADLFDQLGT